MALVQILFGQLAVALQHFGPPALFWLLRPFESGLLLSVFGYFANFFDPLLLVAPENFWASGVFAHLAKASIFAINALFSN